MSTTLTNGIIIPDNGSRNWGGDLANNWNILDVNVGYMNDVKTRVTTLETSVTENTANIQINASNISALQTSKQDVIEDLETIRAGASAGATAVQPSTLSNYLPLSGGVITGNIENRSDSDGWKPGFEWMYNNARFAYIHAFTNETNGEKLLSIQADTQVNLVSQNLKLSVLKNDGSNTHQNALNFQCQTDGTFNFYSDNPADLGSSTNRWKDIYATNATINTSDRNAKTSIENIHDDILEAWDNVSLVSFKFKDSVEKKGDEARIHAGYIAQNIKEELKKHCIDARRYGLFCYNSWDAQEEKSHEEERIDEKGNTKTVKVIDTPAREAGETYGLRYIECLVVECAYLRKKNKELEDRITNLEKNLNA